MKRIKIKCGVPGESGAPDYKQFEIDMDEQSTILDALKIIYQNHDENVAFYSYCRQGLCAGCRVELDGRKVLACKTLIRDQMEIKPIVDDD